MCFFTSLPQCQLTEGRQAFIRIWKKIQEVIIDPTSFLHQSWQNNEPIHKLDMCQHNMTTFLIYSFIYFVFFLSAPLFANMITSFAWVQFFHSRFKYFFQTDSLVWEELVSPLSLFPPFGFKFSFRLYVRVSPCQSRLFSVNLIPVGANRKNLMAALCPFWMFQLFHTSLRKSVKRLHSNLIYQGSRWCKGESKNKLTSRAPRLLQRRNQTQLMFFDSLFVQRG